MTNGRDIYFCVNSTSDLSQLSDSIPYFLIYSLVVLSPVMFFNTEQSIIHVKKKKKRKRNCSAKSKCENIH